MITRFKCDWLLDQHLFIGDVPVGYKCTNYAAYEDDEGTLWCHQCSLKYRKDPTGFVRPLRFGKEYQKDAMLRGWQTK